MARYAPSTRIMLALSALLLGGCLSDEEPGLHSIKADAEGRVHPALVDCDTIAEFPQTITAADVAATPRADRLAEELALVASGQLVAPDGFYERVAADVAALQRALPEFANAVGAGCYVPDFVIVRFDAATFEAVDAGRYAGWDELNALLRAEQTTVFRSLRMVRLALGGLYNRGRIEQEYLQLPGVELASMDSWVGLSLRACVAERSFYNFYILARGSGDCPVGCSRWRYTGLAVGNSGRVTPLGEFETDSGRLAPAWYENARDCRAVL